MSLSIAPSDFEDVLTRAERTLSRVEKVAGDLIHRVGNVAHLLPGFLGHHLREILKKLRTLLAKLLTEVKKLLRNAGNPLALYRTGHDWTGQVGAKASALTSTVTLDQSSVDDYWQGAAADAYKNTLPRQEEALAAIKAATDDLQDALVNSALALVALWVTVVAALVMLVVELTVEAGAAATVVGAPPAAAAGGISLAKVIIIVAAAVAAFATFATVIGTKQADLDERLNNNDAFPRGAWPRSGYRMADLGDGSISDGDDTNWHIK